MLFCAQIVISSTKKLSNKLHLTLELQYSYKGGQTLKEKILPESVAWVECRWSQCSEFKPKTVQLTSSSRSGSLC